MRTGMAPDTQQTLTGTSPSGIFPVGVRLSVGLAALVVFLILALATLAMVLLTRSLLDADDTAMARQTLSRTQTAIIERFARYEALLHTSRSHWETLLTPTLADWETYVERLDLAHYFPGSLGLAFIRYTPVAEQAAAQGDLRAQGVDMRAETPVDRNFLCLIIRHAPLATNRSALGIDSCTNSGARPALLAARDSGLPQLSGRLRLHQLPDKPTAIFYLPVYRRGLPLASIEERALALDGWMAMPMLLPAALEGIVPAANSMLYLYDGPAPNPDLILFAAYGSDKPDRNLATANNGGASAPTWYTRTHTLSEPLSLAGRTWTLVLTMSHPSHVLPWLVGGLGLAVSVLAGALVIGFGESHARAQRLATRITLDLQVMAARLDGIVSAAGEGICGVDPKGRVSFLNPAGAAILGQPAERFIGHPVHEVLAVVTPPSPETAKDTGTAESGTHPLHEFLCDDGAHHSGRTRLRLGDGQRRDIEYLASPIRSPENNEDGEARPLLGGVVLFRDIGAQIAADAERSRTMARLESYAAELERFNQLTAHDLQEPLRGIHSYAQILGRRYRGRLDEDADRYLRFILDGADRMKTLLEDVLEYVSTQPPDTLMLVDADAALQSALNELAAADSAFPRSAIASTALPTVWADGTALKRLFMHVIDNAVTFHRPDLPPEITVSAFYTGSDFEISICDNGIGIAPEYREVIFAGFQRLHPQHKFKGSGVGLAICRKLVAGWNGRIWAQANPQGGTIVIFTVPDLHTTYR